MALGYKALASGDQSLAIGGDTHAKGAASIAIGGDDLDSIANDNVINTAFAEVSGSRLVARTYKSTTASGQGAVALGVQSTAAGNLATSFGTASTASGDSSTALGVASIASGVGAFAAAPGSKATGKTSIAIGALSNATGDNAVALGREAKAESLMALALGNNVVANLDRSVALGAYSTVSGAVQTNSATVGDITYSGFAGSTPATGDVVSVGEAAARKRQIQNVAAGQITSTSTDAINGSQLYATNSVLSTLAKSVKTEFGGDAALNPNTGEITFSNIGNTGKNTIHDAIVAVKENVVAGDNVVVTPVTAANGSTTYTIDAKDTTANHSAASADFLTVTAQPQANNVTNYETALTTRATDALKKAETAVQNIASPDGSVIVSKAPNDPNTTNLQVNRGTGISLDADGRLTVAKTTLVQNNTSMKFAAPRGQTNNFVNAGDLAKHLNDAGFKLAVGNTDGGVSSDTASDEEAKRIRTGDVLTMTAGKGMNIKQVDNGYEFAVDSAEVGVAGNKATVPTDSDNKMATVGSVAKAINESGFTLKTSANGGELLAGSGDEVINPADTVEMIAGKNLTVQQDAAGKITYATKENVAFTNVNTTSLTAGPVTINNNGINAGNTTISNVGSGGNTDTNAANIADVKNARTVVTSNDNTVTVKKTSDGLKDTYDLSVNTSVPTTTLTTDKGNVTTPAAPDSYVTAGNLATTINNAVASAKEKVKAGTNVASVVEGTEDGRTTFTVNAKGTTASAGSDKVKVTPTDKDGNITDYAVDLSEKAKESLSKADTAVQNFKTAVNGNEVQTVSDGQTVNFVNGNVTTARADGENITFDVNFDEKTLKQDGNKLAVNTTTLTPSETDGTVTADNPDNLVTANDIANAINKAGFKLTATKSEGEVVGTSEELVNAGETVTIDAGKNIKLTQAAGKITVATKDNVEFNNVTVNGDVKAGETTLNKDGVKNGDTSLTKDGITVNNGTAGEPVTLTKDGLNNGGNKVTNVADGDINADSKDAVNGSQLHDIIEKGFKIAADQGDDDTVKLGETVAYRSESGNIVTKVSDNKIDFDLADKITVGNNTANPVTIDGMAGTVTGLSNKTWDPNNIVSGQAATEDQLKEVSNVANAGWNLTAQGENSSNVAANDTVDLNNTDGNIVVSKTADQDDVTFNLAKDINVDSVTFGDNGPKITNNGGNINVAGNDGSPTKITGVKAGEKPTDAVNVSQLRTEVAASKENVVSSDNSIKVERTVNADFSTDFDVTVNVDEATITKGENGELKANTTTLADADNDGKVDDLADDKKGNLITAGDVANAINASGFKAKANGDAGELINPGDEVEFINGSNIEITREGGKFTVATKKDVTFDSVTFGDNGPKITNNGGNINVAGNDGSPTKITGVKAGEKPTDAVNVSQLEKAQAAATTKVEGDQGVTVTPEVSKEDGSTTYTVAAKTDGVTTKVDEAGNIAAVTSDITADDKGVSTATTPTALATAGDVAEAINNSGFNVKSGGNKAEGDEAEATLINPGEEVEFNAGKNLTVKRVGNVFTYATADDVEFNTVKATTVTTGDTTINNDGLTINNGPSVTKTGINANNTKITNVANGTEANDAVNVSQLKGMAQNIYNDINYVNNRIGQVDREAKAGIASAMAFEEAPFVPGKWTYAVGAAHYGGEQAVAATLRKTADNGRWAFSGGISTASEGDTGFRIGVSGVID